MVDACAILKVWYLDACAVQDSIRTACPHHTKGQTRTVGLLPLNASLYSMTG